MKMAPPFPSAPGVGTGPEEPISLPCVSVKLTIVKLTLLPTLKIRTASFPVIVTDCPVPSKTALANILIVFVNTITPLQPNETLPPPASAVSRLDWSQVVTVLSARANFDIDPRQQRAPNNTHSPNDGLTRVERAGQFEVLPDDWRFGRRSKRGLDRIILFLLSHNSCQ